jgi:hypothetical protein
MPFEKLMEYVAALSVADHALPMGELAGRWGEPVQRVADAITAVRVMDGERTYITVDVPAPERKPCKGFRWIGQSFASCDRCGFPAWEHAGEERIREGASPFGLDNAMEFVPWKSGEAEAIRLKWGR